MPRPQLRAWNWASYSQGPVRLGAFVPSGANFACDLERGARRLICSHLQEIVTQEIFNLHQSRRVQTLWWRNGPSDPLDESSHTARLLTPTCIHNGYGHRPRARIRQHSDERA